MRKLLTSLAIGAALMLGACATVENAISTIQSGYSAISGSGVPPQTIAAAISTFDGLKIVATNYTRLARCRDDGSNRPICRDPAVRVPLRQAVTSGTVARNDLKAFLRQNPNSLGDQGLYNALTTASNTISDATAAYRAAAH